MTDFFKKAQFEIEQAQNKLELLGEWLGLKSEKDRAMTAGWELADGSLSGLIHLGVFLEMQEAEYKKLMQSAEEVARNNARELIKVLEGKTFKFDTKETNIVKHLMAIITPYSNYTNEQKALTVGSCLQMLICRDLNAYHAGKNNVLAEWLPENKTEAEA